MADKVENDNPSSQPIIEPQNSNVKKILSTTNYAASYPDNLTSLNKSETTKLTEAEVPQSFEGVIKLAKEGNWRATLRLIDQISTTIQNTALPHVIIQLSHFRLVAFIKLRLFKNAVEEINGLGNLEDSSYQFETYPNHYPSLSGSFVPFSLRILQAELPAYQGNVAQTLDLLYALLGRCQDEISALRIDTAPIKYSPVRVIDVDKLFSNVTESKTISEEFGKWNDNPSALIPTVETWKSRFAVISFQIASYFIQQREYHLAVPILEQILHFYPNDTAVLSALGRLFIQIGIHSKADEYFSRVSKAGNEELIAMNSGFLEIGKLNYDLAINHFSKIIDINPDNFIAVNNKVVCYLYLCQLPKAIQLLEESIASNPIIYLQEIIVLNLTILYDIQLDPDSANIKKANLMKLVAQYASDSFDHSLFKKN